MIVTDTVIGVAADAWGLVGSVVFSGDCATTTVTQQTIYTDTDAAGNSRSRLGWWISLNRTLFTNVSNNGAVRIFATIIPADNTMQSRVIGNDSADESMLFRRDWKMTVYPRGTYDHTYVVRSDGAAGAFTTLSAAIAQARSDAAATPKVVIDQTGFYELTTISGTTGTSNAKGLMLITTSAGVTATLGRASAYDPDGSVDPSSWQWRTGWNGIEFRGAGVVFDMLNWASIVSGGACWFNGCKFTNTVASPSSSFATYWNKGGKPELHVYDDAQNLLRGWLTDCTIEYQPNVTAQQLLVSGCKMRYVGGSPFDRTDAILANYVTSCDTTAFNGLAGITVGYGGAGMGAFSFDGTTFRLKVNGSTVASWTTTDRPGGSSSSVVYDITDLAGKINGVSNWSATVDGNILRAQYLGDPTTKIPDTAVNTPQAFTTSLGLHSEVYHAFTDGPHLIPRENVHIAWNVVRRSSWTTAIYNFDAALMDVMVRNNVMECTTAVGASMFGYSLAISHCVLMENQHDGVWATGNNSSADAYCRITRNIINGTDLFGSWQSYPAWTDNLLTVGSGKTPAGANDTNNYILGINNSTNYNATYTDKSGGDYRPANLAVSQTVTTPGSRDILLGARTGTDAAGACRLNVTTNPASSYPF